jgi:hypothetical protein
VVFPHGRERNEIYGEQLKSIQRRRLGDAQGPPTFAADTTSLTAPGAQVTIAGVQATEIAGRLTPAEMAALQAEHGTEFAQIYLTGSGHAGAAGSIT